MSLLRHTMNFGSMTLISRILGFVRDVVLARWFGAGWAMDAFVVAFKIPNFLRRLFAEGSFSLAFVPVLNEYREKGDQRALKELIDATTGALLAVLLVTTALGMLGAGWIVRVFAPGFMQDPQQWALATDMLRVTFPYLMLIALTALAGGILNTLGRFALPALTPALLNVSMITAAVGFSGYFDPPIKALAWGVLVAGILQLAVQLPVLIRHHVLPKPWPDFNHPGVRKILKLMVPTLFGSSVAQINLLFDTLIASLLVAGSISWLYYADRLMEFPLGLFGVALSTVILPTLSRLYARQQIDEFKSTLNWSLWMAWAIGLPAAVGLAVLAGPIITTLFHYGAFTATDVSMATLALTTYCLGLPAFIGVKVLAPAFFSRQDATTPVRVAVIALVTNMALNVVFVLTLAHFGSAGDWQLGLFATLAEVPGLHAGLALASSLTAWLNAYLLWRGLGRVDLAPTMPLKRLTQVAVAAGAMAGVLWTGLSQLQPWLEVSLLARAVQLGLAVVVGAGAYAIILWLVGVRPVDFYRPDSTQTR